MTAIATLDAVAIAEITPADDNVRSNMDKAGLKELAKSIDTEGILQPLRVRRLPGGGFGLVAGHRRLAAVELVNEKREDDRKITHVPCSIVEDELTDADRTVQMLVENLQREDINPVDEAEGYQRLVGWNMTGAQIAARVGRSGGHVSKRLKLLALPPDVLKLVGKGELSLEVAGELADAACDDPKLVSQAVKSNGRDPVWQLRRLIEKRDAEAKVDEAVNLAKEAGIPIATAKEVGHRFEVTDGDGWVYLTSYGGGHYGLKGLVIDEKAHRKEPCRGLLVVSPRYDHETRRIVECCTEPKRHTAKGESDIKPPRSGGNGTGKMTDEEKARRDATIAANRARREATAVRNEVIGEKIGGRLPKGVTDFLVDQLIQELTRSDMARERKAMAHAVAWLGLEPKGDRGMGEALRKLAAKSPADGQRVAMALVLGLQHEAMAEGNSYSTGEWGALRHKGASMIAVLLDGWGHELAPQEKIDLGMAKPKKPRVKKAPAAKVETPVDPELEEILDDEVDDVEIEDDDGEVEEPAA